MTHAVANTSGQSRHPTCFEVSNDVAGCDVTKATKNDFQVFLSCHLPKGHSFSATWQQYLGV